MEQVTNKKKVLVVDDDENLRSVLVDKLNVSGFHAEGAFDGSDGLKKALETHPDMILLDVMMPNMDGWQVLEKLRQDEWGKGAKVIMLTVLEEVSDIEHALEKGTFRYLVKTKHSLGNIVEHVQEALRE
jgi:DNA-binding response OmpR family regulator